MTGDSSIESLAPDRVSGPARLPGSQLLVRIFAVALGGLLAGYMFLGRGFAHIAVGPVYVGDCVLLLGLATVAFLVVRDGARAHISWTVALIVAFMGLGALRTVPYLGTYGRDALRDGALWGYGLFALIVYLLADRDWLRTASRGYGWLVPVFALWLPASWLIFRASQVGVDLDRPGSNLPLVFFKAGDMAIHTVGAVGFLVFAPGLVAVLKSAVARFVVSVPLAWTLFITGAVSRGAILTMAIGLGITAIARRRTAVWKPFIAAVIVIVVALSIPDLTGGNTAPGPSPTPSASQAPSQQPEEALGRQLTIRQWIENVASIFGTSTATTGGELGGTKAFRLAWWRTIVDYTVFGPYLLTGKGFGINLADADDFQPTLDHSLRAPHNTHLAILARMGVPGLALWGLLQLAFVVGLVRATLAHRRYGDVELAALGAWLLAIWAAMMVDTSFDPYLEGPQGGIWFWVVFGLGLVVTRLARRPAAT